jgi:hypothetical protein
MKQSPKTTSAYLTVSLITVALCLGSGCVVGELAPPSGAASGDCDRDSDCPLGSLCVSEYCIESPLVARSDQSMPIVPGSEADAGAAADPLSAADGGHLRITESDLGGGVDPCEGVTCDSPPVTSCANGTQLESYASAGECVAGVCEYSALKTECVFGCAAGVCTPGKCEGVVCDSPPDSSCDANDQLTTYQAQGICSDGACTYALVVDKCAHGCADKACLPDPCADVVCDQAPADACTEAGQVLDYDSLGVCAAGECSYSSTVETCANGCSNGACIADLCGSLSCDTPPANYCKSNVSLAEYSATGTCASGACGYVSTNKACPFGCVGGACKANPCKGVVCEAPPAPSCSNGNTLKSYSAAGVCQWGSCSYTETFTQCPGGCSGGICSQDPCDATVCDSPPLDVCTGENTKEAYPATGTCNQGVCSYTPADVPCPFGCGGGSCFADPCDGMVCETPPLNTCNADATIHRFAQSGICSLGTCVYAPADDPNPCEHGCENGACKPDPCVGVVCNTPPPSVCSADLATVKVFASNGTCNGGTCGYPSAKDPCPFGCSSGECLPDPCQMMSVSGKGCMTFDELTEARKAKCPWPKKSSNTSLTENNTCYKDIVYPSGQVVPVAYGGTFITFKCCDSQ